MCTGDLIVVGSLNTFKFPQTLHGQCINTVFSFLAWFSATLMNLSSSPRKYASIMFALYIQALFIYKNLKINKNGLKHIHKFLSSVKTINDNT